jgi:hypothetical protein
MVPPPLFDIMWEYACPRIWDVLVRHCGWIGELSYDDKDEEEDSE